MNEKLSPQAQDLLRQLQIQQQQLQGLAQQRQALEIQKIEVENALEELGKPGSEEVFKIVGPILVKRERKELIEELTEAREAVKVRLERVEKQLQMIEKKALENQKRLQSMLKEPSAG